jgi:hypothetical protein
MNKIAHCIRVQRLPKLLTESFETIILSLFCLVRTKGIGIRYSREQVTGDTTCRLGGSRHVSEERASPEGGQATGLKVLYYRTFW